MKVHITAKQMDEFMEVEFKNGVCNWNKERQLKLSRLVYGNKNYVLEKDVTIGKMIEILDNEVIITTIDRSTYNADKEKYLWCVCIECQDSINGFQDFELVDALWAAVKYVLEVK